MAAMEVAYAELAEGRGLSRLRSDSFAPTTRTDALYSLKSMDGICPKFGVGAVRINSDIITWPQDGKNARRVKVPAAPNQRYVGLVLLFSVDNGEPLAIMPDGVMQRMRVGAANGLGVKYLARKNAKTVGILGSGWQAGTQLMAVTAVRDIEAIRCFSPTKANRERFGREMAEKYGLEVKVCDSAEQIYRDADIVAALTDSAVSVIDGPRIEKGAHIVAPGTGGGIKDQRVLDRIDVYLRFGNATTPWGADPGIDDEYFTYAARPDIETGFKRKTKGGRGNGAAFAPERTITFADIVAGSGRGRASDDQISYSERGNLQGNQFWALAGRIYELAKAQGLGREIPTEWLLQDIRD